MVALEALEKSDSADALDRKKDAKAELKREQNWDKHTKAALNGNNHSWISNTLNWMSGRDSQMKKIRKAQAYGVTADKYAEKTYTKDDFKKAIGKRCPLFKEDENGNMVIQKLTNVQGVPLVTVKDGKYDISVLSEFISTKIGADNTLSRQANKADSELESIRAEFRKQGVELTKRDTRQLVEFCGYHVEYKNYMLGIYDATIGAGTAAAGTAVALFTQGKEIIQGNYPNKNHLELNLRFNNLVGIDLEAFKNDETIKKLIEDKQLVMNETAGGIQIIIDQEDPQGFMHTASKHIGLNILKSAAVGAGIGLLKSMLEPGPSEKNVFSRDFECRTYEDFIKWVDARKELRDEEKMALKQVAINYIVSVKDEKGVERPLTEMVNLPKRDEKGQLVLDNNGQPIVENKPQMVWRCDAFKDYLNRIAGYSSNLNHVEFMNGKTEAKNERTVVEINNNNDDDDDGNDDIDDGNGGGEDDVCPDCETKIDTELLRQNIRTTKFNKWDDLVNGYDCLKKSAYNKAVKLGGTKKYVRLNNRMMKVVQAMNTNIITTEEQANKFYNIKTIAEFTEDAIKYGINKAIQMHPDFPINKEEYLNLLNAGAGVKGNVYVPDLYDPDNDDTCSWTETKTKVTNKKGKGSTSVSTKTGVKNGKTTYFKKCHGETEWVPISKEEYDALQKK